MACERKWYYRYRLGVRLRGGHFAEAADLGKIYHRFQLEGPGSDETVKAWVREKQAAIVARIEKGEDLDGTLARKANKMTDLFNIAQAMAEVFWERFPTPDWLVDIDKEVKIEMTLPEPWQDVLLSGTIDRLVLNTKSREVWVRDHKSTGMLLAAIFSGAGWRVQGRIYRLLAEHWLVHDYGSPVNIVRGFILDGAERPGIKLCRTDVANAKKWNCTEQEAYLRRVKEWYKEKEGKDDAEVMKSRAVLYTEDRYPQELVRSFDAFQRYATLQDARPSAYHRDISGHECFNYNKVCIYHDLCDSDPKNWDELFEKKFKIVTPEEAEAEED
jgi:hypothetical protein